MSHDLPTVLDRARDPRTAGEIAILHEGGTLTWAELASHAAACAHELKPGEPVVRVAHGRLETVVAFHAALLARRPFVPIHPRLTPSEAAELADRARAARGLGPDACAVVFTSGTEGAPKGAVLSRAAVAASARAVARRLHLSARDRWIVAMPLAHVGGLAVLSRALVTGCAVLLEPRFEPACVLAAVRERGATVLSVVPTMLTALLEADREGVLARLRAILVGGAAASPDLVEQCDARALHVRTTYGLTEACSTITLEIDRGPGCGPALDGMKIRIVDSNGIQCPPNAPGRILVRGASCFSGYVTPEGEVRSALDPAGFFDTGDFGQLDDRGVLTVHARRTDLIVTGGENVYPAEVELALTQLPGVRRALVFGVPDERWGQVVAAALVLEPGVSLQRVLAAAHERLAPHKAPRLACAVDELPLTSKGAPDRASGRDRLGLLLSGMP